MVGAATHPRSGAETPIEGTPTTAFGKYQLFASLGRGGMADVFLSVARGQMGFNKLAVIKRLRQALAEEPAFRNMFLDEARLAARLSHPNIVHTYEVGEQNGVYFIAMEYLEGQSLNKVLKEAHRRKEGVEHELAARIIADALGGLSYAHTLGDYDGRPLGIIHRDVSPHNIFVTYDGHTKLVDFGIAKAALSSTETEVGVLKGKVSYMSPQQALGGPIDQRADIFAMGIVLWEMLARRRLMTGESAANTLHKLMNEPIPRVSALMPNVDPALDAIVGRALEKDPQYRWQSAAEMRDALELWLRSQDQPARTEEVGHTMQYLFASVREDVQRQVQRHMSAITAATNTQDFEALTAESRQRMDHAGANVSGQLLRLGGSGSGSGSGAVPSYEVGIHGSGGYQTMGSSHSMSRPPHAMGANEHNTLLTVIAIGFFLLAGLLIVVLGLRDRRKADGPLAGPSASPSGMLPVSETALPSDVAGGVATAVPIIDPASSPTPATSVTTPSAAPAPAPLPTAPSPAVTAATANTATATGTGRSVSRNPPLAPTQRPGAAGHGTAPASAEDKEPGFLTINVYPWAKVSEGGHVLCAATPCNKIQLSPGTHTLQLENPEQEMKQSTTVTIKSGETATRAIGFK